MVLSTSKVHISYWVCAVGSGPSNCPPLAVAVKPWGTHCPAKPLKAALPQREGSVSHRHLGSGSNSWVIFFEKAIVINVIELQRESHFTHWGLSEEPEGTPVSTACVRTKEWGSPKLPVGGLAPAECKDHGVFIFISEEIKKKPGNKC